MRHRLSFCGLLFVSALTACSGSGGESAPKPTASKPTASDNPTTALGAKPRISRAYLNNFNVPSTGLGLEGYCPVAYFAVNKPVRGKPEHSSEHAGLTYHFVSAEAKSAFDADPKKYLPAYGGWCAFGMSVEDKFPVDPTRFKIVDGRLLLFLNNAQVDAHKLWENGDEETLLVKANAHWSKIIK